MTESKAKADEPAVANPDLEDLRSRIVAAACAAGLDVAVVAHPSITVMGGASAPGTGASAPVERAGVQVGANYLIVCLTGPSYRVFKREPDGRWTRRRHTQQGSNFKCVLQDVFQALVWERLCRHLTPVPPRRDEAPPPSPPRATPPLRGRFVAKLSIA